MKILVTGATGFVGYHVASQCVKRGLGEVCCLVRPTSERKFVGQLPVKMVEGDLRDKKSLQPALKGCELLFHVAADYRLWSKDPRELVHSNVEGSENILQVAAESGVKRIVYTSSVSAVGRPEHQPCDSFSDYGKFSGDESMDPTEEQLIGPYKRSKYEAELAVRKFAQSGLNVVIVNPSTPVGSHDHKPTPTGKLILDFLNKKMPAYLDTGLNLVDVEDVAAGHLLAWEKGKAGERYILGNQNLMLKEILDLLAEITGMPAPRFKIPYWVAYTAGYLSTGISEITGKAPAIPLDGVKMARELMFYKSEKAVRELGLPQSPIKAALEKAVNFFKDHGYVRK